MALSTLYIKNMVCPRCIAAVEAALNASGIPVESVVLGEARIKKELSSQEEKALAGSLQKLGFSLIDDKRKQLSEKVKNAIVSLVHGHDAILSVNLSDYLSEALQMDYAGISQTFSEEESITVEKYYIAQKIERVKELLTYDELTLSEIAYKLGYSSVAHLSAQFKKVTNETPSQFKTKQGQKRKSLDRL